MENGNAGIYTGAYNDAFSDILCTEFDVSTNYTANNLQAIAGFLGCAPQPNTSMNGFVYTPLPVSTGICAVINGISVPEGSDYCSEDNPFQATVSANIMFGGETEPVPVFQFDSREPQGLVVIEIDATDLPT